MQLCSLEFLLSDFPSVQSWEVRHMPAPLALGQGTLSAGGRFWKDSLSSRLDAQHCSSWFNYCYIIALFRLRQRPSKKPNDRGQDGKGE